MPSAPVKSYYKPPQATIHEVDDECDSSSYSRHSAPAPDVEVVPPCASTYPILQSVRVSLAEPQLWGGRADPADSQVVLHVYDLAKIRLVSALNTIVDPLGRGGVYHVGVAIYGVEFSYGYECAGSGIKFCVPMEAAAHSYRSAVPLGTTVLTKDQVAIVVEQLCEEWQGPDYHLMRRNCTHFATELCGWLGVGPIPHWSNRISRTVSTLTAPLDQFYATLQIIFGVANSCAPARDRR